VIVAGALATATASAAPHTRLANSQTFVDQTGDALAGHPDVTTVQLASDDRRAIEIRISIPNRPRLEEHDSISVYFDTDQNVATGCSGLGNGFSIDWSLAFIGHTEPKQDSYALAQWRSDCKFDPATPQGSYRGRFDENSRTLILRLSGVDIANPQAVRFVVTAWSSEDVIGDIAGDHEPWVYRIAPQTTSQTFTDAEGDSPTGQPDVTTVQVANDNGGAIEIRITFSNRQQFNEGDFVGIELDTDQSAATGCDVSPTVGIDWLIAFAGHADPTPDSGGVGHLTGCTRDLPGPSSFYGTFDGATSTAVLRLNRADLGNPASFRLLVRSFTGDTSLADVAGESTPWIYTVVIRKDTRPPVVRALPATGVRGKPVKLRYTTADDSGATREKVTIYRNGRRLVSTTTRLRATVKAAVYVVWPVPRKIVGELRFCVRAWDRAGNASKTSCARLTIK
jgi:hypothetical protein